MLYTAQDLFTDWYSVGIKKKEGISPEELESRRTAIQTILKNKDLPFWIDLVKITFGVNLNSDDNLNLFIKHFKDVDPNFPLKNNENIIGTLAGCTVSQKIELDQKGLGDALALAIMIIPFLKRSKNSYVPDLEEFAFNNWVSQCYNKRKIDSSYIRKSDQSFLKVNESEPQEILANIQPYFSSIIKDLKALYGLVGNILTVKKDLKIVSEELNILWWVFGTFSKDFDKRFEDIKHPARMLQLVKELADFTEFEPGIGNVKSFLTKSFDQVKIDGKKKLNFYESLNTDEYEVLKGINNFFDDLLEDLTPCLTAINNKLEYGSGKTDWTAITIKKTNIKLGTNVKPIDYAYQLYLEIMLKRIVDKSDLK